MQPNALTRYLFIAPAMLIVMGTTIWPLVSALTTSFATGG